MSLPNDVKLELESQVLAIKVRCPECESIEDEQYTCTTCWGKGYFDGGDYLDSFGIEGNG